MHVGCINFCKTATNRCCNENVEKSSFWENRTFSQVFKVFTFFCKFIPNYSNFNLNIPSFCKVTSLQWSLVNDFSLQKLGMFGSIVDKFGMNLQKKVKTLKIWGKVRFFQNCDFSMFSLQQTDNCLQSLEWPCFLTIPETKAWSGSTDRRIKNRLSSCIRLILSQCYFLLASNWKQNGWKAPYL